MDYDGGHRYGGDGFFGSENLNGADNAMGLWLVAFREEFMAGGTGWT